MRDVTECNNYQNGNCTKWGANGKCDPTTIDMFEERIRQCAMDAVCEHESYYGNFYFYLTDEDIIAIKAGKVLYDRGEYGIFLAYKKEALHEDNSCS